MDSNIEGLFIQFWIDCYFNQNSTTFSCGIYYSDDTTRVV